MFNRYDLIDKYFKVNYISYNMKLAIVLGILLAISIILLAECAVKYNTLEAEYESLEEKYGWAMEFSKMTPDEREKVAKKIGEESQDSI